MPSRSPIQKYQHFITRVENVMENHVGTVWICGDFNMPHCTWSTEEYYLIPTVDMGEQNLMGDVVTLMADFCAFRNLYQVNSIPNDTSRTLDLILSTDASTTVTLSDEALVPADNYHPPLIIKVKKPMNHYNVSGPQNNIFYYDFKSTDLSLLNDCLGQVNWDKLLFNHSVDNMVNIFYDIL